MSDSLLAWYERELGFLRSGGCKFAQEHPQSAHYMGKAGDTVSDPHVSRVVESFALLNAGLYRQLLKDTNQLSNNLLHILFPLVLQPLPSVSLLQVSPSRSLSAVTTLPSGTRFKVCIDEERFCEFHTTSDLQCCPFDFVRSVLQLRSFSQNREWVPEQASATLRIDLAMLDEAMPFSQLPDFPELTIHFQGLLRHVARLYDCLFYNRHSVVLTDDQGMLVPIPESCFRPLGMEDRDRLITQGNTGFITLQGAMEVLAWPELFYGFRLVDFGQYLRQFSGPGVSLLIFIEDVSDDVFFSVDNIVFRLGCAPMINLFDQIAEPVVANHRQLDYPLIPDVHSPNNLEIQSIKSVLDVTGPQPKVIPQLYCMKHNDVGHDKFWIYNAPVQDGDENGRLGLVCPELNPNQNQITVLSPRLVCSNGNQVLDIPDYPRLECLDSFTIAGDFRMLMRPTQYIRRSSNKNWLNLLTHLKPSFLSSLQEENAAASFRNLLQLYFFNNNAFSRAWLDSIISFRASPMVAPLRVGNYHCVIQGSQLIFELDPEKIKQSGLMMFVNLLDYMTANYAGYHSFLDVVIRLKGKPGDYVRCVRRYGYRSSDESASTTTSTTSTTSSTAKR